MTQRPKPRVAEPHGLDVRLHRLLRRSRPAGAPRPPSNEGWERIRRRVHGDRGASLVEYSLIFALVLVVSIGATKYLGSKGSSQVATQADCVSRRPSTCVLPVLTVTTTTIVGTTTLPITTTTLAGTTNTMSGQTRSGTTVSGATFTITNPSPPGGPMTGVTVTFTLSQAGGTPFNVGPVSCNSSGVCTLPSTTVQFASATTISVNTINGPYYVPKPASVTTT